MRTNTISRTEYDKLPHQMGDRVEVEYFSDREQKRVKNIGTIYNLIGYGSGKYTINIKLDNGWIVAEAHPEFVKVLKLAKTV